MPKYFDLKIEDDDLKRDENNQAVLVWDRDSIAQDIKHMIRETGLLVDMIGERNPERRRLLLQKITIEVERDERIVPGTVTITDDGSLERWTLHAETYEYGAIAQTLEAGKR